MLVLETKFGRRPWVEDHIRQQLADLALVQESITHEAFVRHCCQTMRWRGHGRDNRRTHCIRALRRMIDNDRLPVEIVGDTFKL